MVDISSSNTSTPPQAEPAGVASQSPLQPLRRMPWMLILFVLLLGGIGGFLASNLISKPTVTPQPSIVPSTTIPTSDPTANWKTINGKYWVFKVPSGWNYLECKGADAIFVDPQIKNDQITECNFEPEGLFSISRVNKDYPVAVSTKEGEIYTVVSNKENIFIDNTQAIQQQEDNHGGQGEGTYTRVYVKKSGITYLITLSDITKKEVFDQILSTFKFVNENQTDTTNWKIYKNTQQKFSIMYPTDWQIRENDHGTTKDVDLLSPDYQAPTTGFVETVDKGGRINIDAISGQALPSLKEWFDTHFYDPRTQSVLYQPKQIYVNAGGFNNITALEYETSNSEGNVYSKLFTLGVGDTIYQFTITAKNDPKEYSSLLDQILSTFKFLK